MAEKKCTGLGRSQIGSDFMNWYYLRILPTPNAIHKVSMFSLCTIDIAMTTTSVSTVLIII